MKHTPQKVYECIYIHAAKIRVREGWALLLCSMDEVSQYAFEPVFNNNTQINIEVLNLLFENILKDYNPIFNPKQIVFVTSLPEEYGLLFLLTKAADHRFVHNKEATIKAMKELLNSMPFEMTNL